MSGARTLTKADVRACAGRDSGEGVEDEGRAHDDEKHALDDKRAFDRTFRLALIIYAVAELVAIALVVYYKLSR